jgi:hypothetical protein
MSGYLRPGKQGWKAETPHSTEEQVHSARDKAASRNMMEANAGYSGTTCATMMLHHWETET